MYRVGKAIETKSRKVVSKTWAEGTVIRAFKLYKVFVCLSEMMKMFYDLIARENSKIILNCTL